MSALRLALAVSTALMFAAPALAMPGDGGSSSGGSSKMEKTPAKTTPKKIKCKRTHTAKLIGKAGKRKWTCIKLKKHALTDQELYGQAIALADAGEYEWALDHLKLASNQNHPAILTYTGYANRKAGRLETGLKFYNMALSIDPNFVQAREYLGEAYVLAGQRPKAEQQLALIQGVCGTHCEAYTELKKALDAPVIQ
jgi:Flp pilus assembly protein TadD